MADALLDLYRRVDRGGEPPTHPLVTLTFAQSLDGSIAAAPGEATLLSGDQSMQMTHELRARHQAIMIGIGTVLVDDPQLTVRKAAGDHPVPVILDSRLRLPLESKVLHGPQSPWVVHGPDVSEDRRKALAAAGATLVPASLDDFGIDLNQLISKLGDAGLGRVMIEGGARVIRSVLQQHLADLLVLTISPRLLSGLRPLNGHELSLPRLKDPRWAVAGEDAILWGRLK